ncbi:MAG: barstar family protein [Micropruina sp.]
MRLPGNADRNLDALADKLTELARYWPGTTSWCVWRHPEEVDRGGRRGWCRLADVLAEATERRFETLLLIRGYDG